MFNIDTIRKDFPQLKRKINATPIVYLDSTATSLKPRQVIQKINEYYTKYSANVFRGIYKTSEEATEEYERARGKVARFINALHSCEIVFTRSTTESLNLVAAGFGKESNSGDSFVTTIMEHHSNFVQWQQRAFKKHIGFTVWNIEKNYMFNLNELEKLITRKTKILAITAVSNVLGAVNPIKKIISMTKRLNPRCFVIVDAAQAVPHMKVDVTDWNADAVAFSGHKMLGPTGVGVLWAKMSVLERLNPYQYGGEMIKEVYVDRTVFKEPPHKFEAGTPHIAGVIGLGEAVDYLTALGMDNVQKHEEEIVSYATSQMSRIRGLKIYGPKKRAGVIAFTMDNVHPHDIAQLLDKDNICIRAGNHCAMPLHTHLGILATARASFYVYTTKSEIDALCESLSKIYRMFA